MSGAVESGRFGSRIPGHESTGLGSRVTGSRVTTAHGSRLSGLEPVGEDSGELLPSRATVHIKGKAVFACVMEQGSVFFEEGSLETEIGKRKGKREGWKEVRGE